MIDDWRVDEFEALGKEISELKEMFSKKDKRPWYSRNKGKILGGALAFGVIGYSGVVYGKKYLNSVYNDGYNDGYNSGINDGLRETNNVYTIGYRFGFENGYDTGYDKGFDDGRVQSEYDLYYVFYQGYMAGYREGQYKGEIDGYNKAEFNKWDLETFVNSSSIALFNEAENRTVDYTFYHWLEDYRELRYYYGLDYQPLEDFLADGPFAYYFQINLKEDITNAEANYGLRGSFRFVPFQNNTHPIGMNITEGFVFASRTFPFAGENYFGLLEFYSASKNISRTIVSTADDYYDDALIKDVDLFLDMGDLLSLRLRNDYIGKINLENMTIRNDFPDGNMPLDNIDNDNLLLLSAVSHEREIADPALLKLFEEE